MKVTAETRPAGPVLVLEGDLDHENIGQMIEALQEIYDPKSPRIVLDLAKVAYVDSAGIGAIYDLAERMNGSGEVEITGVSSNLWRIFEVAGLTGRQGVTVVLQGTSRWRESRPAPPRSTDQERAIARTRTFAGRLDQLALIRDFVGEMARDVRLDDEQTFNLQVAVSEASANAVEHGLTPGDVEVSASYGRGRLTITVSHPGRFRPRLGHDPSRGHRGMGLPLMLALTDEVTVSQPPGKGTKVSVSLFLG